MFLYVLCALCLGQIVSPSATNLLLALAPFRTRPTYMAGVRNTSTSTSAALRLFDVRNILHHRFVSNLPKLKTLCDQTTRDKTRMRPSIYPSRFHSFSSSGTLSSSHPCISQSSIGKCNVRDERTLPPPPPPRPSWPLYHAIYIQIIRTYAWEKAFEMRTRYTYRTKWIPFYRQFMM